MEEKKFTIVPAGKPFGTMLCEKHLCRVVKRKNENGICLGLVLADEDCIPEYLCDFALVKKEKENGKTVFEVDYDFLLSINGFVTNPDAREIIVWLTGQQPKPWMTPHAERVTVNDGITESVYAFADGMLDGLPEWG